MIHSICYFSTAHKSLNKKELKQLLQTSKDQNTKAHITGILVYADGNFMQVIEGTKKSVDTLYEKIKKDRRHHNIIKVSDLTYPNRIFEAYKTGFTIIECKTSILELNNYFNWLKNHPSKEIHNFIHLMEQFTRHT